MPMTELEALARLHGLATRFIRQGALPCLLAEAVEVAVAIADAEAAHIQLVDDPGGSSTEAHEGCARVVTALRGASGNAAGLLYTYHRGDARPDPRQVRLLDLLAGQCADAIESARRLAEQAELTARAQWIEKLRETEELFRTTVENMPLTLTIVDSDQRLLYMNPVLAAFVTKACGVPAERFIGRHAREVWPSPMWGPLHDHMDRAVATGERQTFDFTVPLPNGDRMVRQWTVVPLAAVQGDKPRILTMSQDVTAQRRLVEELREADRRKSEFIAVLSHELRNPLAAIRTSLFLLENAPVGEVTRRAQEAIDRQVDHLVRLVDDLLDVNRIAQNKIQLQRSRVDLNLVARETIEDNREHLEQGGVRVEAALAGGPVPIDADRARISQVLTNLLSNAAKFTPAGGTARVSVAVAGQHAVLTVADTGAGIDPALLPRLFQPFMQADRTLDRAGGGLGLGLALVRGLVELQGGDVSARSAGPGHGAEFVVRFPLAPSLPAATVPTVVAGAAAAPLRILLVEDDADIANGLRAVLELDAHQVAIARNGRDALAQGQKFGADVVLCDIGLPGMDGYQVAQAFRADAALRSTFLVALSGYAQAEDLARTRAAGFDEHLAKPVRIDKIQRLLRTLPRR
jgi:PAS domain S-box-containing protein